MHDKRGQKPQESQVRRPPCVVPYSQQDMPDEDEDVMIVVSTVVDELRDDTRGSDCFDAGVPCQRRMYLPRPCSEETSRTAEAATCPTSDGPQDSRRHSSLGDVAQPRSSSVCLIKEASNVLTRSHEAEISYHPASRRSPPDRPHSPATLSEGAPKALPSRRRTALPVSSAFGHARAGRTRLMRSAQVRSCSPERRGVGLLGGGDRTTLIIKDAHQPLRLNACEKGIARPNEGSWQQRDAIRAQSAESPPARTQARASGHGTTPRPYSAVLRRPRKPPANTRPRPAWV